MGWTGIREPAGRSAIEVLREHSSFYKGNRWKTDSGVEMTVESMVAGGGGAYGVLKRHDPATGSTVRLALIILIQRKDGEVFWKEMLELDGPNEVRIPKRLYARLSPIDSLRAAGLNADYAEQWRLRVDAYQQKQAQQATIEVGQVLEFSKPLQFSQCLVSKLRVVAWGANKRFMALSAAGQELFLCRIRRETLANEEFRVI